SRRGWYFLPGNGCALRQTQKMLFRTRLSAFGAAIVASIIALCFILPSARLPLISFDETSGDPDVKSKSLQTLTDRSNLSLKQGTICSLILPRPWTACHAINAKFWS